MISPTVNKTVKTAQVNSVLENANPNSPTTKTKTHPHVQSLKRSAVTLRPIGYCNRIDVSALVTNTTLMISYICSMERVVSKYWPTYR
ncbi:hypothetical protein D3C86_1294150 [compost metagenome]